MKDGEVKVINERHEIIILGRAENNAVICTVIPQKMLSAGANRILVITLIVMAAAVLISGLIADDLQQPEHRRER